jgi:hypothetical protein
MNNINTAIRYVPGQKKNAEVKDLTKRFKGKDNADFLAEVAKELAALAKEPAVDGRGFDPNGLACIGLMGEYGLIQYGIRRAQEVLRVDGSPSYWSHAFLFASAMGRTGKDNRDPGKSPWIWESTLEPASLMNRFVDRNGVGPRRYSDYAEGAFKVFGEHSIPNIAVIAIALTPEERKAILDRADDPDVDRLRYDILGLLGTWYAYLTNRANRPNPLSEGHAIFCSAYVQLAYDAVGIDLAPGAHQRNTSPEHLWQAARYMQGSFRAADPKSPAMQQRRVVGWYCLRDKACVIVPEYDPKYEDAIKKLPWLVSEVATFLEKSKPE